MLLEKKLVKMLNKYHEKCGLCMTREEFVDYVEYVDYFDNVYILITYEYVEMWNMYDCQ